MIDKILSLEYQISPLTILPLDPVSADYSIKHTRERGAGGQFSSYFASLESLFQERCG
ncbi:hypothetical protein [Desulfosporosinus acidiphilus]|uniref:hypothetical protein n=1 Tax=Desulfosporosinus acidiphilus TaxID=885581 RepID=UPI0013053FA9|nr:hypothetical protein [Desulfosporosinus acidiphilus]